MGSQRSSQTPATSLLTPSMPNESMYWLHAWFASHVGPTPSTLHIVSQRPLTQYVPAAQLS